MILPDENLRNRHRVRVASSLLLGLLLAAAILVAYIFSEIRQAATMDQRRHADAIAVFGAAEYDGRPSPVLRARLDHALMLYQDGYAPLLITLGGYNSGDANSDSAVVISTGIVASTALLHAASARTSSAPHA